MQTRAKAWLMAVGVLLPIGGPACDPATAVALPVIVITNTWSVQDEENRSFQFTSNNDGEVSGTFTGSEFVDFEEHPLAGTWDEGELEFIVGGDRGGVVYTGTFHDRPDQLTIQSSTETLVLVRNVN